MLRLPLFLSYSVVVFASQSLELRNVVSVREYVELCMQNEFGDLVVLHIIEAV